MQRSLFPKGYYITSCIFQIKFYGINTPKIGRLWNYSDYKNALKFSENIGSVCIIMLFCKSLILKWLKSSLSAVGKMELTNYVMHSVFVRFIFTGAGFGLF